MEFTPYIKNKWNLYTMLILDSDFSFTEHIESKQYLRLGMQCDKKIQFGAGADFEQKTNNCNFTSNYGVFMGYAF